jgi:hypothetical protein
MERSKDLPLFRELEIRGYFSLDIMIRLGQTIKNDFIYGSSIANGESQNVPYSHAASCMYLAYYCMMAA